MLNVDELLNCRQDNKQLYSKFISIFQKIQQCFELSEYAELLSRSETDGMGVDYEAEIKNGNLITRLTLHTNTAQSVLEFSSLSLKATISKEFKILDSPCVKIRNVNDLDSIEEQFLVRFNASLAKVQILDQI